MIRREAGKGANIENPFNSAGATKARARKERKAFFYKSQRTGLKEMNDIH
ncbi:MAG: hypothetical protein AB7O98_03045 [Hyphomonadaceae bacterium]